MIYDADVKLQDGTIQHLEVIAPDEHEAHIMINNLLEAMQETQDDGDTH